MTDDANPWPAVPSEPPYWLPCDSEYLRTFNAIHLSERYRIQDRVLPEPFIGSTTAPVVLLNLNPGFVCRDLNDHAGPELQSLIRNNYRQAQSGFPFYSLDPRFENGGRQYWEKKLRWVVEACGPEQVARNVLCIEYFPYHSLRFRHESLELPSQEFGFKLACSAIERKAVIVVMRAERLWRQKIPELGNYPRAFTLNSPQNPTVSPRNCPREGFDLVVSAIRGGQTHGGSKSK